MMKEHRKRQCYVYNSTLLKKNYIKTSQYRSNINLDLTPSRVPAQIEKIRSSIEAVILCKLHLVNLLKKLNT